MIKVLSLGCVGLLAALIALPFLQVVLRDAFGAPLVGAVELTRFLLICSVFLAYPLVVRSGENIVMGELHAALPASAQRWLSRGISALSLVACAVMALVTLRTIGQNLSNATPTLGIPFWLFLGACGLGFAGGALYHAIQLVRPVKPDSVSL